jgi:hypothetical protein
MDYRELAKQIEEGNIKSGDTLFVTDFRYDDILNKPIRHILPTEVIVTSIHEVPIRGNFYHSNEYFRAIHKNGKISNTVIAPYDNTRARTSINIFLTLEEAKACYVEQCRKIFEQAEKAQHFWNNRFEEMKIATQEKIRKNSR